MIFKEKSKCEWLYIMTGAIAGFISGILILGGTSFAVGSTAALKMALMVGVTAPFTAAGFFAVFRRYPFFELFFTLLLPGLVIGAVVVYVGLFFHVAAAEPLFSWLLGAYLGALYGAYFCVKCNLSYQQG